MNTISRETIALAGLCTLDLLVTAYLISTGLFTEGNPLLAHYLQYGILQMCLVKMGSYLLPLGVAEWYRREHPYFVQQLLRATVFLYIGGYIVGVTAVNFGRLPF